MVIPTTGRDSLERARASAAAADEVVVVEDATGDRGYTARTVGMARATGTHLAFLDDDDIYTPGAIDLMRRAASDRPVIFRMDDPFHGILWRTPELVYGNVGTPMFLVPNRDLGEWKGVEFGRGAPRGGDFNFITGCVEKQGAPVWRKEIIATVRPEPEPTIAVVTPWIDHPELEADYAQAIRWGRPEQLLVIDNGSDPPLTLPGLRSETNLGFCAANNLGLEHATTDAVLFLNNDVYATDPGWLRQIRDALQPGVLVGPALRYDRHAGGLPYLDGWCLAGMTSDLRDLGGWDETLQEPAYWSDNLLCLRARAAGITLREVKCGIRHKLNGSTSPRHPATVAATAANHEQFLSYASQVLYAEGAAA